VLCVVNGIGMMAVTFINPEAPTGGSGCRRHCQSGSSRRAS
jgi:hypothetical protein